MALVEEIRVEIGVIILYGVLNDWVFGLVALDNYLAVLVAALGATDDLGDELVTAFLGREIG